MITQKTIKSIYRKYRRKPTNADELNVGLLFEKNLEKHKIEIKDGAVIINSVEPLSPFHEIPLDRIHAIIDFDLHVAIVLHSSIVFLRKDSDIVDIDLKMLKPSILDYITMKWPGK